MNRGVPHAVPGTLWAHINAAPLLVTSSEQVS